MTVLHMQCAFEDRDGCLSLFFAGESKVVDGF